MLYLSRVPKWWKRNSKNFSPLVNWIRESGPVSIRAWIMINRIAIGWQITGCWWWGWRCWWCRRRCSRMHFIRIWIIIAAVKVMITVRRNCIWQLSECRRLMWIIGRLLFIQWYIIKSGRFEVINRFINDKIIHIINTPFIQKQSNRMSEYEFRMGKKLNKLRYFSRMYEFIRLFGLSDRTFNTQHRNSCRKNIIINKTENNWSYTG